MKREAVRKAVRALERAEAALAVLTTSHPSSEDFSDAWDDILHHLNRIEEVLRTGSKRQPKSERLVGTFRHLQKKDPLLKYVHEARNAEHHGLTTSSRPMIELTEAVFMRANADGLVVNDPKNTKRISVSAHLVAVTNRHGNVFNPPRSHLGSSIRDRSPANVAQLALTFYRKLVSDASALA